MSGEERFRAWGRNERAWALGIFALAVLLRVLFLCDTADAPSFNAPTVDAQTYDRIARALASGQPMDQEMFWQPFFYPFFLAGVYRTLGPSMLAAKLLQVALGGLTCVLTFALGRRLFDLRTAIIAGLIAAAYGPMIFFESSLVATGWAAFWSAALMLVFLRAAEDPRARSGLLLGLVGAASILTRPTFLPFFFAGCAWLVFVTLRSGEARKTIALHLLFLTLGFLILTLPVATQNQRVTGRFGILPSSGGMNLYLGNNPQRDESLTARPGVQWQRIIELPERNQVYGDRWVQQRFFREQVEAYLRADPLGFLEGLFVKGVQFMSSREIPRNDDIYVFHRWSVLLRGLVWKVGGFGFPFGVLLPLAVLGWIEGWRRLPAPVTIFLLIYPLSIVLVFVSARYRIPVIPVLAVLAAAGGIALEKILHARRWKAASGFALAALGVILFSSVPGPFAQESGAFEAELNREAGIYQLAQGANREATRSFQRALELKPDYAESHDGLAQVHFADGDAKRAALHWTEAVRLEPEWAEPLNNLAWILATRREGNLFDPQRAVRLAERANSLSGYTRAGLLDTLAVAYAATGRYAEAVGVIDRALQLAPRPGMESLPKGLRRRRALFVAGEPYFE